MSSSPEQDFIGIHIKAVGSWTNKLIGFVDELTQEQKKNAEMAGKKLQLKTPGIDVIDEKDKEAEQKTAMTLESNTGTLNENGSYGKNLEVRQP